MPKYERTQFKWTEKDHHLLDCEPVTHLPIPQQIDATLKWIARLPITQGQGAGHPVTILDWEKEFLKRLLSTENQRNRDFDCTR